jgi:hypothetical protein
VEVKKQKKKEELRDFRKEIAAQKKTERIREEKPSNDQRHLDMTDKAQDVVLPSKTDPTPEQGVESNGFLDCPV